MATPSHTGLRWATAVCGHHRPACDPQSDALGEHLRHCRVPPGRPAAAVPASPASTQPGRRLAALLARATRLIR